MKQYEYKASIIKYGLKGLSGDSEKLSGPLNKLCEELAAEGWELLNFSAIMYGETFSATFRREKQE